jgi:hypothetical protein
VEQFVVMHITDRSDCNFRLVGRVGIKQEAVSRLKFTVKTPQLSGRAQAGQMVLVAPHGAGDCFNVSRPADLARVHYARVLFLFQIKRQVMVEIGPPNSGGRVTRSSELETLVLVEEFGSWSCTATMPPGCAAATQLFSSRGLGSPGEMTALLKVVPVTSILGAFEAVPNLVYRTVPHSMRAEAAQVPGCMPDDSEGCGNGSLLWLVNTRATMLTRSKREGCAALAALWEAPAALPPWPGQDS